MLQRLFLLPVVSVALFACEGTSNKTVSMMLDNPIRDRQISSFDQSTLFVDITVNAGPIQNVVVPRGVSPIVGVTGIVLNRTNTMDIRWYEVINGIEIDLSRHSQTFVSEGTVTIDAPHQSDQFDSDNDGISNLAERLNGTCVLDAAADCVDSDDNSSTASGVGPEVFITSALAQGGTVVQAAAVNNPARTKYYRKTFQMEKVTGAATTLLSSERGRCAWIFSGEVRQVFRILLHGTPVVTSEWNRRYVPRSRRAVRNSQGYRTLYFR